MCMRRHHPQNVQRLIAYNRGNPRAAVGAGSVRIKQKANSSIGLAAVPECPPSIASRSSMSPGNASRTTGGDPHKREDIGARSLRTAA